jgi:hypothetical protein
MFRSITITLALCLAAVTAPVATYAAGIIYGTGLFNDNLSGWNINGYDVVTGALVSQFGAVSKSGSLAISDGIIYGISRQPNGGDSTIIGYDVVTGTQVSQFGSLVAEVGGLAISPVPIPATAWLLATGIAGLGGRRWMRRKVSG